MVTVFEFFSVLGIPTFLYKNLTKTCKIVTLYANIIRSLTDIFQLFT